jgi:hypothetical protein
VELGQRETFETSPLHSLTSTQWGRGGYSMSAIAWLQQFGVNKGWGAPNLIR